MPAPKRVDRDEFARLAAEGFTNAELKDHFECSEATVTRLRKLTATVTAKRMTPDRLNRIAAMLDDGMPFNEIHRTEGADPSTLRKHFPGRQWTTAQAVEHRTALRTLNREIRRTTLKAAA